MDSDRADTYGLSGPADWGKHLYALGTFILDMDKMAAIWCPDVALSGFTMRRHGKTWLLVIKAKRRGRPVVCFFAGRDMEEAWLAFAWSMRHYLIQWKEDKYK